METIVITGVCGTHGRKLVNRLKDKYRIIGIDNKNWTGKIPVNFELVKGKLQRKVFGEVIRKNQVAAVIHLAITKHFKISRDQIHELNVMRAQRVIETCICHKIAKVILLSEHSVYGALPNNPMWLQENSALNGSRLFSENSSFVTADLMFTELFWRAPEISTVILRPVNIIGPTTRGLLNTYLKLKKAPAVWGFDPLMQIIHEDDVSLAMELSLNPEVKGIYNVLGPGSLPLSVLARESGLKQSYMPLPLAKLRVDMRFKIKRAPFPASAMTFFQFPICVEGSTFVEKTGFVPQVSLEDTVKSICSEK